MPKLSDLLQQRSRVAQEMREIADNPNGTGGDISEEQNQRFDTLKSDLTKLDKDIERHQFIDEAEHHHTSSIGGGGGGVRWSQEIGQ